MTPVFLYFFKLPEWQGGIAICRLIVVKVDRLNNTLRGFSATFFYGLLSC